MQQNRIGTDQIGPRQSQNKPNIFRANSHRYGAKQSQGHSKIGPNGDPNRIGTDKIGPRNLRPNPLGPILAGLGPFLSVPIGISSKDHWAYFIKALNLSLFGVYAKRFAFSSPSG